MQLLSSSRSLKEGIKGHDMEQIILVDCCLHVFECMDFLLKTTRSKAISSSTSPIMVVERFPCPGLSTNVKSLNPLAKNAKKLQSKVEKTYFPCVYNIYLDTKMQYLLHQQHHLILSMVKRNQKVKVNPKNKGTQ